ncbi:MAG: amidohydrolase [Acidobacteria bacterium]|nr:amidohydrolase [Acidobacteriota bacterium]
MNLTDRFGRRLTWAALVAWLTVAALPALAQTQTQSQAQSQNLTFEEYDPKSTLVVPEHKTPRAKFPLIDIHSHHSTMTPEYVDKLIKEMDSINLRVIVNLSGGSGERLKQVVTAMKGRYPDRFVVFANVMTNDINEPGFGQRAAARLAEDVKNGAQGLKIFKNFGMDLKYKNGDRVKVDDPEWDPIWAKCAELGIPVLIHVAEPDAFFLPIDKNNERWLELKQFPGRARPPEKYPPFETLMTERNHMLAKNPKTKFILAHMGYHGNNLERLGKLFDTYPNAYVDVAAVLAEIGRQPYTARDFFIKYQDRLIFGKDIYEPSEYTYYFRVFETRDDYIEYYRRRHAFWRMYGLYLPDEVLKKVYYKNALRLVPGMNAKQFPD